MPAYEFRYLMQDGSPAARFLALLADDQQAKALAHAVQMEGPHQIAVWDGERLIFTRPMSGMIEAGPITLDRSFVASEAPPAPA